MAALTVNDIVTVLAFTAFVVANTYTIAQADSTFVQNSNNFSAGKNKFINGNFSIWQRGTSFTNPADQAYNADRFKTNGNGTGATKIISRQTFTPGAAPVAGYEGQYFYRFAQTVAGTGATYNNGIQQTIEDARTFAGQTVTWSFWAKADSARTVDAYVEKYYGTSGSGYAYITVGSITLTTSWTRYSLTFAVPSVAGATIGANSYFQPYLSMANNTVQTFDFWGWQIESGSVATSFSLATGSPATELAACQRYYVRYTCEPGAPYAIFAPSGFAELSTYAICYTSLPVELRTYPTSVEYGGSLIILTTAGTGVVTSISLQDRTNTKVVSITYVSSGLTATTAAAVRANNSSTAYLGISAEL
jgi:hypothetical protein